MAISDSSKVDLLYKKYFGVTKTDTATNKGPSNESIASPLMLRSDTIWQQSSSIPGTAGAVSGIVQAYTGSSAVQCTADTTSQPISSVYPSWKTNLTNWIPSEFGSTYFVQVWVDSSGVANPTSTGTRIYDSGSGGTGEWNFDYSAGVLNFIGGTIPAVLTSSKVIYIVGYRYVGATGISNFVSGLTIANITITGNTIAGNANITLSGNVTTTGNLTAGNLSVTNVSASNVMSDRGFDQNNWDTLTQIGVYAINRVSWSGVQGAPTDSLVFTGLLEVLNSRDLSIVQIYRPNDGSANNPTVEFVRSKFNSGSWTSWVMMVNNYQIVDCGSY